MAPRETRPARSLVSAALLAAVALGCGGSGETSNRSSEPADLLELGPATDRIHTSAVFDRVRLDGYRVMMGGPDHVSVLDARTGVLRVIDGSDEFANPRKVGLLSDGSVVAVDTRSGAVEKLAPGGDGVVEIARFDEARVWSFSTVRDQAYVHLQEDGVLVALDANGAQQWTLEFEDDAHRVDVVPLADDEILVGVAVGPEEGGPSVDSAFFVVDQSTGQVLEEWRQDGGLSHMVRWGEVLHIGLFDGTSLRTVGIAVSSIGSGVPPIEFALDATSLIYDDTGVPFADLGDDISRLDPASFETETTIRAWSMQVLGAGPDALYVVDTTDTDDDFYSDLVVLDRPIGS